MALAVATALIGSFVTETTSAATPTSADTAAKHKRPGVAGFTHPVRAPQPPSVKKQKPEPVKKPHGPVTATSQTAASGSAGSTDPAAALHSAQGNALVHAKAIGKPVAIPEMTTESSTATANPDGTISVSTSLAPVRAKVNNTWVPIDTTLTIGSDDLWHPKAAPIGITFSNGGGTQLAMIDRGGKKISVTWPLGPLPSPHADGNNLTYPAVLPGIDLRVSADPEGIREVLIVHDATAAANPALSSLHFGISGTGVSIASANGGLTGTDTSGKAVFTSPAPQMWDATDNQDSATTEATSKASYTPSHHDLADSPGRGGHAAQVPLTISDGQVHLAIDRNLFRTPALTWPIYIDPSITVSQLHYAQIHSDGGANNPALAPRTWYDVAPDASGDQIMRVGWDGGSNELGDWRSMFSFDVYNTLETNAPGDTAGNSGAAIGDSVYEDGSNLTNVSLSLWSSGGTTTNPNIDVDAINRFPGYAPSWNTDGNGGMWNNPTTLFGSYHMSGAGTGNQMFIGAAPGTPLFNVVKNAYTNRFNAEGDGTITFGLKASNEAAGVTPYWGFFYTDHLCGCYPNDNATLTITFTPFPYIIDNTLSGAPNSGCGLTSSDATLQQNAGYVRKNIGNQVTLGGHVGDIDSGRTLNITYDFQPYVGGSPSGNAVTINAGQVSSTLGMTHQNPNDTHSPYIPNPQQLPGATLTQTGAGLVDGTLYRFEAHAIDNGNTSLSSDTTLAARQECYFIPAFTSPNPPAVTSTDFPQLGNQPKPGIYATVPSSTGFSVTGSTSGVPIDHYDYLINGDSSQVPYNPPGCTTSTPGCAPATPNSQYTATIPVAAGATTFGTNTLWIRAVDKAGNTSAFYNYSFYLPGNPTATPVLGNVTGNGVPDIVAIAPDGHGNSHLVVFPGNEDPNVLGNVNNAIEAAPASAAPDGKTWANTLITHRGADRGVPVDDLFAFSTTTKSLYYYLNSSVFGGTVPTDMFSQTHQILVTRPTCSPSPANGNCAGYAPDWSNVTAILALGNAAGGKAGTFAGRTNLITVENDGNHGAYVWMFSPAGAGQLINPILLSYDVSQFNWVNADLIAPGATTNSSLPDLWARDRISGTLYQFINKKNTQGIEDPTSLGDQRNATVVGTVGQFNATTYPTLVTAGNPTITSGTGSLAQTGPPALWGIQPDGQLKLFPGSSSGPITTSGAGQSNAWSTSGTGWVNNTGTSSVNGGAVAVSTGPIHVGVDQFTGNNLCMDLQSGNTTPNTPVWIFECNGTAPQVWTIMSDGTIRYGGPTSAACLQVSTNPAPAQYGLPSTMGNTAGIMAGAPVVIGNCPTSGPPPGPMQWVLRPSAVAAANFAANKVSSNDWYNFYNPNSGRYLDNPGNSTAAQTQLQIWDLTDTQAWLNANNPNYRTQEFEVPAAGGTWLQAQGPGLATQTKEASSPSASTQNGQPTPDGTAYVLPATAVGNHYGVDWYMPYAGDFAIWSNSTTGPANGQTQLTVTQGTGSTAINPTTLPMICDTYLYVAAETQCDFGTVHIPAPGIYAFTFTVTGQNSSSTGYTLGLDTLFAGPDHGTGPDASLDVAYGITTDDLVPATVTLDATQSFPGAAALSSYSFDFGDGTTIPASSSATAVHIYTTAGTYTAAVTVTDAAGVSATALQEVDIAPSAAPRPLLTMTPTTAPNVAIVASGYGSDAMSAPITNYSFNFGDGTPVVSGVGTSAVHSYAAVGTYTVTLSETNSFGTSSTTSTETVTNVSAPAHVSTFATKGEYDGQPQTSFTFSPYPNAATIPGDAFIINIFLNGQGPVSVTDSQGNTYVQVGLPQSDGSAGDEIAMFAAFNTKPLAYSDQITITVPNGSAECIATADEYSGIGGIDRTAGASGTGTAFTAGPTATTTKPNDLVVGAIGAHNGAPLAWNAPVQDLGGMPNPGDGLDEAWTATTATGAQQVGGAFSAAPSTWMAKVAAFTPASTSTLIASLTATNGDGQAPLTVIADASASIPGPNPIATYTFDFGDGTVIGPQTASTATHVYTSTGTYTAKVTVTDSASPTPHTSTITRPVYVYAATTPPPPPAVTYIGRTGSAAASTPATTLSIRPSKTGTAGDALVVSAMLSNTNLSAGIPAVNDTQGNSYRLDINQTDTQGDYTLLFTATGIKALTPSDTITMSFPAAGSQSITVDEYSGATVLDQVASSFAVAPTRSFNTGNTPTTTSPTELVVAAVGDQGGTPAAAFSSSIGYNVLPAISTNGNRLLTAYKAVTANGNYNATGTISDTWAAGVVTLAAVNRLSMPALSDPSWTANGTAAVSGAGTAAIASLTTDGTKNAAGSLVNSIPVNPIGLTASFSANITGNGTSGADGMTFALLDASKSTKNALGTSGSGLGIEGQTGVFFSLNTSSTTGVNGYTNWCGIGITTPSTQSYDSYNTSIPALRNTGAHTISLSVTTSSHIVVTIDGIQVTDQPVTLPPSVLVAFTASTDTNSDAHIASGANITYLS